MEYKRLTGRNEFGEVTSYNPEMDYVAGDKEIRDRLALYEDSSMSPEQVQELAKAKAEGRLVVLPCKVGDKIYSRERNTVYILERKVCGFVQISNGHWLIVVKPGNSIPVEKIGKTAFFTREAAENALNGGGQDV